MIELLATLIVLAFLLMLFAGACTLLGHAASMANRALQRPGKFARFMGWKP